ncbi:MAG: acyl-CoA dehydrogenase [Parahaliea sp.]
MLLALILLIAVLTALLYYRVSLFSGSVTLLGAVFVLGLSEPRMWWLFWPVLAAVVVLNHQPYRLRWLTRPVYALLRQAMPPMSDTEREALEAGTTWWEQDLFSGRPNWQRFAAIDPPRLSEAEQSFLDHEVETLCAMIDEWEVHRRQDLSEATWDYLKQQGFFGLIIPQQYGGRAFSPYAQSRVMSKIASRSITAAVTAMVPNSLGPGELLMKYGTEEQRQRWLPGLARGEEIPCFGLTGPEVGSDAGAIPDTGVVCRGEFEGTEVIGLRLNFRKRWITLAPVATVVGLAFKLRDPEGLLGDPERKDYGITCALLPATTPGVEIGTRHNPGLPFMNGPIIGRDVFIPIDWIIGGPEMAGRGWRMLIECLGVGRGISLPSLATASAEMNYLTVGAFARIRRQFNLEVGKFEGVQEATADIAATAVTLEAMRELVTRGLQDGAPAVVTAMAKYHATELMRSSVNRGMDVVSGRGIQLGPRNFLAFAYRGVPVAITVEGANILTRSLMIFGQGAMRCHPYLFREMQTLEMPDQAAGLRAFDDLFLQHLGHVLGNIARLKLFGVSGSRFSPVPAGADAFSRRWYQHLNHMSAALAVSADVALGVLGGQLKRREMLSARLGDVHSQLFIACSLLKFREHAERSEALDLHVAVALEQSLLRAQNALLAFLRNFPVRWLGMAFRLACFPLGRIHHGPSDEQLRHLGRLIMEPNPVRKLLATRVYLPRDGEGPVGRVERTYQALLQVSQGWQRFLQAWRKGEVQGEDLASALTDAVAREVISEEVAAGIRQYDALRFDCLLTDDFPSL